MQSAEPSLLSIDVVGNIEVSSGGDSNKMVKRLLPHTEATIGATSYLIFDAKVALS